jgi:hypothetical protein
MEDMMMMMGSAKHQALFSASFDTISDAGQTSNHEDGTNSVFGGNTSVLHHNMMLESPIPLKNPAVDRRNSIVIPPRSHYHHQQHQQQQLQEDESIYLQPQHSESREEEQDDARPMMEESNDGESHRSSSEDDPDHGTFSSDNNNQHNRFHDSPPKRIGGGQRSDHHPGTADISPIALDMFDRHGRYPPQGTTTATLMHATSSGSGENQPNEVSFLKSESSSTGADEHGPSQPTGQKGSTCHRNDYPADNRGKLDPHFHRYHYGTSPYKHDSGYIPYHQHHNYHLPPHPNAPTCHVNTIQASPVVPRRQFGPPMVPKWGINPSQRPAHNYPPLYRGHYPPLHSPGAPRDHSMYPSSAHHPLASSRHLEYHPNNPIYILRSIRKAFEGCSYLLHCVRSSQMVCTVNIHQSHMGVVEYQDQQVCKI